MKLRIACLPFFLIILTSHQGFSQSTSDLPLNSQRKYYVDYIMGPYLFVDNIAYDAVFMNGCRLGFNIQKRFNFSIEYVAGQQPDNMNNMGMTHYANGQFAYKFIPDSKAFSPYLFSGGGFFEFKEFTVDVYGIAYHVGFGTTLRIFDRLSGVIEARYLNTGLLDVGGQNQLAVNWGLRLSF
jgi:hypothetical protein